MDNIKVSIPGLNELLEIMRTQQPSDLSSCESSTTGNKEFYGTNSFDEALYLLENGDPINAGKLRETETAIKGISEEYFIEDTPENFIGYDIDSVINGSPDIYYNARPTTAKNKIVNVAVYLSMANHKSETDFLTVGKHICEQISAAEKNGTAVNLDILLFSKGNDDRTLSVTLNAKRSGEILNTGSLAYMLINPSFYRRIYFRIKELFIPDRKLFLCDNYGKARDYTQQYFDTKYDFVFSMYQEVNECLKIKIS